MSEFHIAEWRLDGALDDELNMLAEVLRAVVLGGAGVSFFVPFSLDVARAFWLEKVLQPMRESTRRVLVARLEGTIVGTVQLNLATPPNQPHRADVVKLLVHPSARRLGIARALMVEIENIARTEKRTLLTLDTVTNSPAEALYRSLNYTVMGVIPGYARASLTPDLEDATFLYKQL